MLHVSSTDGQTLAVHDLGDGDRPTLFCHATGLNAGVWQPMANALGLGFRRWAMDFRAHGASPLADGARLDWDAMADDVLAVVDGLGTAPGELLGIGHSMGGASLLLAEQARPGTFAGLWLFEPVVAPPASLPADGPGNVLADGAARRRATFPSKEAALANYASKPPLRVLRADALLAYVEHGFTDGDDGQVHLACRPEHESQIFRGGGAHGAFEQLQAVTCPARIAKGGDSVGVAAFAPGVADRLRAPLESHDHVGHFGPLEAPNEMAMSVRAFADSL
jgi:pimeloyl-ACP methyl ester carboxylesterase